MFGSNISSGLGRSALCETLESRSLYSATVGVDHGFNGGKFTTRFYSGDIEGATSVLTLKDGRVLVAGTVYPKDGPQVAFAVFNKNGTLSTAFNGNGKLVLPTADNEKLSTDVDVQLLADGNILVVGHGNFLKLKTDGEIDTTFGNKGFAAQPDGTNAYNESEGDLTVRAEVQSDGTIRYASYVFSTGLLRVADYSAGGLQLRSIRRTVDRAGNLALTPTHEVISYTYQSKATAYRSDLSLESKFAKGGTVDLASAYSAFLTKNAPFNGYNHGSLVTSPPLSSLSAVETKTGYVFSAEVFATSSNVPITPDTFGGFTEVNFYVGATGQTITTTGGLLDGTQLKATQFNYEYDSGYPYNLGGTFVTTSGKVAMFVPPTTKKNESPADFAAAGDGSYYVVGESNSAGTDDDFSFVIAKTAYIG